MNNIESERGNWRNDAQPSPHGSIEVFLRGGDVVVRPSEKKRERVYPRGNIQNIAQKIIFEAITSGRGEGVEQIVVKFTDSSNEPNLPEFSPN